MTTRSLLSIILISVLTSFKGQDTLNKFDSEKKANGYWKEFLSEKLTITIFEKKGKYFHYSYYEHGRQIPPAWSQLPKIGKYEINGNKYSDTCKSAVLLHGNYKLYDKKGRILLDQTYENGVIQKDYCYWYGIYGGRFKPRFHGKLYQFADYTDLYQNQPHSFRFKQYNVKTGEITFDGYYRKGENGWDYYSEK